VAQAARAVAVDRVADTVADPVDVLVAGPVVVAGAAAEEDGIVVVAVRAVAAAAAAADLAIDEIVGSCG